ncbi:putative bifunctional diguanylate cyclase/phosphodiesterase [Catenuloplanes atrovinosus]|uniref:Diguanylate cyclase (GGDEF)-like protein n=1 Tax=Catenuloplanes atrovinosus TaxID=137266 RepID=A0AAE3YJY6_9ACTN|nr:bifunctional diguanylate cyclase/phosphodiesterase [Catenuloplanes atrovinosus]MDR7274297.1 diguanylate cyclase (GGDEF)-like protein [Catenuloplanes atrovinosus]
MRWAARAWPWWPAGGMIACLLYVAMPDGRASAVMSAVVGSGAVALVLAGVRRKPAGRRGPWWIFGAGLVAWVAGDEIYAYDAFVTGTHPYPSWADACYLAAYPLFVISLFRLTRDRRPRDFAALLDAAMIATGLGLVYWLFVIGPIVRDDATPIAVRMVTAAYPTAGVLLVAVVGPLLIRPGRRSPSLWMLTFGSAAAAAGNVGYTLLPGLHPALDRLVFGVFLFSYFCFAGAALHPSGDAPEPPRAAPHDGWQRIAVLSASTLLVPLMLFIEAHRANEHADVEAIGVGAVVLFLLMLIRLSGFFATVQRQAHQLERLAMADELTGLANRRLFEQNLAVALRGGLVQVAVLDLNGFKEVNDTFGHAAGDRLLTVVAQRLREAVRDDDVVARMGGDEFAVLVREVSPAAMSAIAERIGASLRRPVEANGQQLLVSASVGTAGNEDGADVTWDEMLRRADAAMYAAKRAGGGRHLRYTAELDAQATVRARAGAELREALEAGQFHLVYQPIVQLPEGRIVSVEALVRWSHPERGFVSPAEFVPIAEETGLIVELGEWILRQACARAVAWHREYGAAAPQRISVNVSARQLAEPGFAGLVAAVLTETGLRPEQLVVELTETAVFDGGQALRTVEALHRRGVRIALDDFGTGHSSLTLLRTVPVDVLKVDKSFVDKVTMAGRHAVIATALIQVSDGLGLQAVAEGVETAEQAEELFRLGYRLAQGYHFGKPVAQPDFTRATRAVRVR